MIAAIPLKCVVVENDTFFVDRSRLLRRALTLYYPSGIGYVPMHMEIFYGRNIQR